jgi:hypothetical protein
MSESCLISLGILAVNYPSSFKFATDEVDWRGLVNLSPMVPVSVTLVPDLSTFKAGAWKGLLTAIPLFPMSLSLRGVAELLISVRSLKGRGVSVLLSS